MPVTPSRLILNLTASLYPLDVTLPGAIDADGALVAASCYPTTATKSGLACGWNPEYPERSETEQGRVSGVLTGLLLFGADPGMKLNDKVVLSSGETLYVDGEANMAGRSMCWGVKARAIL